MMASPYCVDGRMRGISGPPPPDSAGACPFSWLYSGKLSVDRDVRIKEFAS